MPHRRHLITGAIGLVGAGLAWPAFAGGDSPAMFKADLRGDAPPANTGSKATGHARLAVDTGAQTVDLDLAVSGITLAQLWDHLKAAPIGPVHLHHYGSMQHMADDPAVSLVLPVPYGPDYAATADGFKVTMRGFRYATGAALLNSQLPFADFMAAMQGGLLALNVHTNAFQDGEINGAVVAA
jgi:hypothetical protein